MARRNEQIEVDLNLFVGGLGLLGVCTEFQPPNVDLTGVESESSPAGKYKIFYGAVEEMEAEWTVGEHNANVYNEMGMLGDGNILSKRSFSNGELGKQQTVEHECRGQISTAEDSASKRGEKVQNKVKMSSVWYYKKTIDGKVVCEIDKKNGICRPDGKIDMLEVHRTFISS